MIWDWWQRAEDYCLTPKNAVKAKDALAAWQQNPVPGTEVDLLSGDVTGNFAGLCALQDASGGQGRWTQRAFGAVGLNTFKSKLPVFQQQGSYFLRNNALDGVLNNDDVGLGKTVESIAGALDYGTGCNVVLCPAYLRAQWRSEIERWCKELAPEQGTPVIHVVWPKGDKRSKVPPPQKPDWVVAYYLDAERAVNAAGGRPYLLIIDEIHNLRGWKTQRITEVQAYATFAAGRVGLTASLLYNDAAKLHPILSMLQPGQWGTFGDFARRYCGAMEGQFGGFEMRGLTHADELRKRLSTMSFRRTREEVAAQLPFDTKYQTVWLDAPGIGNGMRSALTGGMEAMMLHIHELSRLKTPAVVEAVRSDLACGVPSLVFTWLREHAKDIAAQLPGSLLVLGGNGGADRGATVKDYVAKCATLKVTPCVVGTLDAMSEGLNLQWAKVVNLASLDYTPEKLRQAVGRAARMGQTGTVTVRVFAVKGSADEHYIGVLRSKLEEQFKLDGRKEQTKADLYDSLEGKPLKAALASIYERYLKEEGGE